MSFVLDWVWNLLYKLGFWKKNATILLLGLDNAGKTTLLHKLKHGSVRLVIPTQRAQLQEIELGNVKFRAWDLGGHEQVRSLWKEYFFEADAVIFLVDSADDERFEEAKKELNSLLDDESLKGVPFLILANKTDMMTAWPLDRLIGAIGIENRQLGSVAGDRPIQIFRCSLVEGTGYGEGFRWLSDIL
eukprot:TRINITY_DN3059_c0_g1_i1.p1 TRINITY_DN3059_c0_g1~~TRINITY_DN3059_c0_g1_i1.p1  ORF type:complete len:188 (-),score=36.55 TRINITY_DN3059_c0_g1_i1:14-577(-)